MPFPRHCNQSSAPSIANDADAVSPFFAFLVSAVTGAVILVADPLLTKSLLANFPPIKLFRPGWPIAACSAVMIGVLGFGQRIGLEELALAVVGWQGERWCRLEAIAIFC